MRVMNHMSDDVKGELIRRIRDLCAPLDPVLTGAASRLDRLEGIRCVLFDMYGTLLVSGSGDVGTAAAVDSAEALEGALVSAGVVPAEEHVARRGVELLGRFVRAAHTRRLDKGAECPEVDIRDIWRQVLFALRQQRLIDGGEDEKTMLKVAVEYECRVNPVWPMPGMKTVLDQLLGRPVRLGIVSNAQFYTPLVIEAVAGCRYEELGFDPALCSWSYRVGEAKPSVSMFVDVLQRLEREHDVRPPGVLYVGNDMRNDVWTASRAGCRTALFAGDKRSLRMREDDERCRGVKPDVIAVRLEEISECV